MISICRKKYWAIRSILLEDKMPQKPPCFRRFEEAPVPEPSAVASVGSAEAAAEAQPMRSPKAEWLMERLLLGAKRGWDKLFSQYFNISYTWFLFRYSLIKFWCFMDKLRHFLIFSWEFVMIWHTNVLFSKNRNKIWAGIWISSSFLEATSLAVILGDMVGQSSKAPIGSVAGTAIHPSAAVDGGDGAYEGIGEWLDNEAVQQWLQTAGLRVTQWKAANKKAAVLVMLLMEEITNPP